MKLVDAAESREHAHFLCPNKIGPYELRAQIGEGAFSIVRLAVHEQTGTQYACKIISKKYLMSIGIAGQFEKEVDIQHQLRHPAICCLYDIFFDAINYYAILDLCPFGNLRSRVLADTKLSEPQAKFIFKQILSAVDYMHSQKVVHRDLKPENVLVDDSDHVKIIDFGMSDFQPDGTLLSAHVGSLHYLPPECLHDGLYDGYKYDVWSCGVILCTMLTGSLPWRAHFEQQMVNQISEADYFLPVYVSETARDLISKVLVVQADRRLTIREMLDHPWLAGVDVPHLDVEINRQPLLAVLRRSASAKSPGDTMVSTRRPIALGLIVKGKSMRKEGGGPGRPARTFVPSPVKATPPQ
jgi:serine/threonine protein kinase